MQLTTSSFTSQKTSNFTTNKSQVFTIGGEGIGKCHESRVRGITVTPTSLLGNQRGGLVDKLHGVHGLWWAGPEFGLAETNWVCQCALETGLMEKMSWNLLTEDWEAQSSH